MEKIHLYDKILSPIVTEKSTKISEFNQFIFRVDIKATSKEIKIAIEKLFKQVQDEYKYDCPKFKQY